MTLRDKVAIVRHGAIVGHALLSEAATALVTYSRDIVTIPQGEFITRRNVSQGISRRNTMRAKAPQLTLAQMDALDAAIHPERSGIQRGA